MPKPVVEVGGIGGVVDTNDPLICVPPTCLRQRALRLLNHTFDSFSKLIILL